MSRVNNALVTVQMHLFNKNLYINAEEDFLNVKFNFQRSVKHREGRITQNVRKIESRNTESGTTEKTSRITLHIYS
jgi:hypothetical protein